MWAASCLEVSIWIWIFLDTVESLKGDWDCHCFSFGCYWKFTVNALNSDPESTFESCIWVLPVPRTSAENLWYKLHVFVKATAHIQRVQAENNLSPSILTFCSEVCVCIITSSNGAYSNHRKMWEWEPLCLSWCPLLKQYLICIDVSSYFYFYVVGQGFKEKLNPLNFWDGGKLLCLCVCVCKTLCVAIKCY